MSSQNMRDAEHDLRRVVWPTLADALGWHDLQSTVVDENSVAARMDRDFGIDCFGRDARGADHVRGRRAVGQARDTFTWRESYTNGCVDTEQSKRLHAYRTGGTLPQFTVHAYVALPRREGALLSVGVVSTRTLCQHFIDNPWKQRRRMRNPIDGTYFVWAEFADLVCETVIER